MKAASLKRVAGALCVVAIVCACGFFSMSRYYQQALPRSAAPKNGHVYPRNNHGVIVYYSRRDKLIEDGLFYTGFILALVGGLLWKTSENQGA